MKIDFWNFLFFLIVCNFGTADGNCHPDSPLSANLIFRINLSIKILWIPNLRSSLNHYATRNYMSKSINCQYTTSSVNFRLLMLGFWFMVGDLQGFRWIPDRIAANKVSRYRYFFYLTRSQVIIPQKKNIYNIKEALAFPFIGTK